MNSRFLFTSLFVSFFLPASFAQNTGGKIFRNICSACHTIGKGTRVGPDLSHVYDKMSSEWLLKFIRSWQDFYSPPSNYCFP